MVLLLAGAAACGGHETNPIVNDTDGACLIQPEPGIVGFRYQCEGSIVLEAVVEGPFDESPATSEIQLRFGHSMRGNSYAEPHVMACCPLFDPDERECEQQHEQACMLDLGEQGCRSLEPNIRDYADESYSGPGLKNAITRAAIHKIADHVRDHQRDCIHAFLSDTNIETTAPSCDPDVEYDAMLEAGVWSFDPDGVVDQVTISVVDAQHDGIHPTSEAPDTCESADDNDHVVFFQVDPRPSARHLTLASGDAMLHGPSFDVMGIAELGSLATGCAAERCSMLALGVDRYARAASLEDLRLRLAGTAEVGVSGAGIRVDDFSVRLWDATPATVDEAGTTVTVPPGGAWFVVSAASGASRSTITASNETAIVLREERGGWTSSAFSIARRLPDGDRWSLVVQPARWK
jgi:hypothetical protein